MDRKAFEQLNRCKKTILGLEGKVKGIEQEVTTREGELASFVKSLSPKLYGDLSFIEPMGRTEWIYDEKGIQITFGDVKSSSQLDVQLGRIVFNPSVISIVVEPSSIPLQFALQPFWKLG